MVVYMSPCQWSQHRLICPGGKGEGSCVKASGRVGFSWHGQQEHA